MARSAKAGRTGTPARIAATRRVRGSRTGRPIMVLLDVLGRRWTLRVLWELREGPLAFRALRERCDAVSPSVLNARLKDLREMGALEPGADAGYTLSGEGRALLGALAPLYAWAARWGEARRPAAVRKPPAEPGAASPRRGARSPRPRR